jgi:hypothetical protein
MPKETQGLKPIGNGQLEATCTKCGAASILEKGDDFFGYFDGETMHYRCSKCSGDTPRASREDVEKKRREILGSGD